ncbi:hypothetical protein [Colwellia psychrerythraea]|uniref:Uncharacterized protein n=1 Tax=Colwellia psychrerythraea TaxID=28229 RepID=A0A099K984_COLPS|nr:hypothetical protein [Colwellia psychrerythraea]KGJ86597.1 hypothetical protein ND2E_0769 [Colwellia psychrerythraea]
MSQSIEHIKVINTVEVNGCYLKEHRHHSERRKMLKLHFVYYDRRSHNRRQQSIELDIEA